MDAGHELDVAHAVLETDQVGAAIGQDGQRLGRELADVAVVDDDAELHALAHGFHVGDQAFLAGFGQVVRQQQDAVGTGLLGRLRALDGKARGAARARDDRHLAAAGVHRGLDDAGVLVSGEREELARAARGEQRGGAVGGQPLQALGVGPGVEVAVGVEVGQREGQQSGGHDLLEVLRGVLHSACFRVSERNGGHLNTSAAGR